MKTRALSLCFLCLLAPMVSSAQTAAPGYAVTSFATGFVNTGLPTGIGPVGLAFDANGNLLVGNYFTGFLYKFSPAGGVASAATQLNTVAHRGSITGLAFTKDGRLYLARQLATEGGLCATGGDVVEVDPSDGAILRGVACINFATGLATDPVSGDLFVSMGPKPLYRISNFANGPGTVTAYANAPADGIAFGPDGTLYTNGILTVIAGTNSPNAGTVIHFDPLGVPADGLAISAEPNTPFLYGNGNNGTITKVDLSTSPPTITPIVTGGSRGDFTTVGPDGCLYATQTDRVLKVTNADGSCLPPPLGPLYPPSAIHVFVDVKPAGCPNPINIGAEGSLPVAILGTAMFDVSTVDPSSVKLNGVPTSRFALEDVATPFTGALVNSTSCTTAGPDGFTDLVLQFNNPAVSASLGTVTNDQVVVLTLTGNLKAQFGGTPITGQDVVIIRE